MEEAIGLVIAPCIEAGEGTCNWLKRKYCYVKNISQNFDKLQSADTQLRDAQTRVQNDLKNNRSTKEATPECKRWLNRVKEMRTEIATLRREYQNRPSTCMCGICPFRVLLKLGKRVVKMTKEAGDLRNEERNGQFTVMVDKPPSRVHRNHRWSDAVRKVNHPSLRNHVKTLIDWLKGEGLKRICIWGPPGVGKTTIMKTVHENLCQSPQFDYSFLVTLKEESRILGDIHEEILKRLGLRMDDYHDPSQRAAVISERLRTARYVLFLDIELSSENNLEEIWKNYNHEHGKVVFACRDKYTGHTDEDMNVKKLSREDARKLFWELVGLDLEKKEEIKENGEKIIDLCGGMPHMLLSIGKRLVDKNTLSDWLVVKSQLQSPSEEEWKEWEEYYRSFKLVYEELPDDHKQCLLYWAIFPFNEEINRDYVIDCWTAEQLLEHRGPCLARDRGHVMLNRFTDKYILEKGETLGHFKMFLCFQWAAFRIANEENQNFFVGISGKEVENEEWLQAKRVSLAGISSKYRIPQMPRCAGMLTLSLHENELTEFPKQFFRSMNGLQVLCIWKSEIGALPSSIANLSKLKGLFLNNCSLQVQLPNEIAKLQGLEILVVRQTGIYSLPIEIGELRNLKCLRVSFREVANQNHVTVGNNINGSSGNGNHNGTEERVIPSKIFQNLSELEELSIDVDTTIKNWNENADEIAKEITVLKKLTHLHFYFPLMKSFEHFIQNSESWKENGFKSFNIFVGEPGNSSAPDINVFECPAVKHLKFSAGGGFPAALSCVLKQAYSFELVGHTTACSLTDDDLRVHTLQKLEACVVEECSAMESVVYGNNITGGEVFKCLEKLHIRKLPHLRNIWKGTIPSESNIFGLLKTLTLKECRSIKIVFSLQMVRQLSKLQNLQVEDCAMIEKIIDAESTVDESSILRELKNFQLCGLTSLSCICDASIQWRSLEILQIKTCEALRSLPCNLENASKLREIRCAEEWWHQLQWPNNETEQLFRNVLRFF